MSAEMILNSGGDPFPGTFSSESWLNESEPEQETDEIWLDDEEVLEAGPLPRRTPVRRSIVWGVIILSLVVLAGLMALGLWGLTQSSTAMYGNSLAPVGPATRARLQQLRVELAAAGASQAVLDKIDFAARPGTNIGDAVEALASADSALKTASPNSALAAERAQMLSLLSELQSQMYGWGRSSTQMYTPAPRPVQNTLIP